MIETRYAYEERFGSIAFDAMDFDREAEELGRPGELASVLRHLLEADLRRGHQIWPHPPRSPGCGAGNRDLGEQKHAQLQGGPGVRLVQSLASKFDPLAHHRPIQKAPPRRQRRGRTAEG